MIHIITISEVPELLVQQVCRHLFLSYGLGAEHSGQRPLGQGDSPSDALALLSQASPHSSFADDKTILLTDEPLLLPDGPLGRAPSGGFADPKRGIAVVTTDGLPIPAPRQGEEDEDAWLLFADRLARRAVQQVGFLWGLHRCVDSKCAMSAPWACDAPPILCNFCRERSETTIQRARS